MDKLKETLNGKNGKTIKLVGVIAIVLCVFFAFKTLNNPARDFNGHSYYVVTESEKPESYDDAKNDSEGYVRFHDDGTTSGFLASGDWKIKDHKMYIHFDAEEETGSESEDDDYVDLSAKTKINGHVAFPEKDSSGEISEWWVQAK
ncbi:hypothetical protein PEAC54167_00735 [Pediococcus acidilactici]|uniref:hypothetical protein n=1 Tax=Pediococcus TaxID=1253 RepID=UPI000E5C91CD|nr:MULTISPECIES: hypothetical protein [Pediococcus]KAF0367827.1 hypothetical protein GBO52_03970 [Pediococcus acidilactici]KAF0518425.1 hypothetical protein GBP29_00625 [Pediococcus acidilactici]MBW9299452.1 hypothetical protein [Pediococcus acidilactici]MCT3036686.1 hypothetical protein [Pediococcus acidilactici]QQC45348.1 hypothetical protein I6H65_07980 [Pediococcus acidilactici]